MKCQKNFTQECQGISHKRWNAADPKTHTLTLRVSTMLLSEEDLSDLVHSCTVERTAFINRLRLMFRYAHRLLVVTSALSQVKSPYVHGSIDPNRTTQFLVAVLAGLHVPFVCSETHELGEKLVVRTCTRFISTTGWSPTITAVFCQTTTYKRLSVGADGCYLDQILECGRNFCVAHALPWLASRAIHQLRVAEPRASGAR